MDEYVVRICRYLQSAFFGIAGTEFYRKVSNGRMFQRRQLNKEAREFTRESYFAAYVYGAMNLAKPRLLASVKHTPMMRFCGACQMKCLLGECKTLTCFGEAWQGWCLPEM